MGYNLGPVMLKRAFPLQNHYSEYESLLDPVAHQFGKGNKYKIEIYL